jgi:hypothetical protein
MDIRKATTQVRLERWSQLMRERQTSGLSITAWCEANGVKRQSFFYWQRRLREKSLSTLALRQEHADASREMAQFIQYQPEEVAEPAAQRTQSACQPAVVLHLGCGKVEIYSGADKQIIENTLQALVKLC